MKEKLKKLMGPNWHVKVLGWFAAGCLYVAMNPSSIEFLPDGLEKFTLGTSKLLVAVAGGAAASVVKGSKVTGGSVPATVEASGRVGPAREEDVKAPRALPVDPEDFVDDPAEVLIVLNER
jgi:hypothetical protein